jgi:hypothetical protein
MSRPPVPVLEVAAYTVHDPATFATTQHHMHTAIATFSGHRAGLRLRGMNAGWYADLVAWESLESAQRASDAIREDSRFADMMAGIANLTLYAHYQTGVDALMLLTALWASASGRACRLRRA